MLGIPLHDLNEIGNQVGAALVGCFHVTPCRNDSLLVGLHGVVAAAGQGGCHEQGGQQDAKFHWMFLLRMIVTSNYSRFKTKRRHAAATVLRYCMRNSGSVRPKAPRSGHGYRQRRSE